MQCGLISDVMSPAFNVEGRQWCSSVIEIFYYYFTALWADSVVGRSSVSHTMHHNFEWNLRKRFDCPCNLRQWLCCQPIWRLYRSAGTSLCQKHQSQSVFGSSASWSSFILTFWIGKVLEKIFIFQMISDSHLFSVLSWDVIVKTHGVWWQSS